MGSRVADSRGAAPAGCSQPKPADAGGTVSVAPTIQRSVDGGGSGAARREGAKGRGDDVGFDGVPQPRGPFRGSSLAARGANGPSFWSGRSGLRWRRKRGSVPEPEFFRDRGRSSPARCGTRPFVAWKRGR